MTRHRLRAGLFAPGPSLLLAVLCVVRGAPPALAGEPESIAWRDDYPSALDEARASNRLLWIQFTGPWCPNCTRMERESFPHPTVVEHSRASFVPLKLRSDVHEQLALDFNLTGLPATIIVAPNRDVVASHQGYLGPQEFDAFLRDCLGRLAGKPSNPAAAVAKPARAVHDRGREGEGKTDERLALRGFCPVSLIDEKKLVRGRAEYTLRHEERTYRFATLAGRDRFRDQPGRFVPANNGHCPVRRLDQGQEEPGDPKWGILYNNHLFVCASEDDRRRFLAEPDRYAIVDVAELGFCTHCIRESGLLIRGDPRHEVVRAGRRYWFPDVSHRDAFLSSMR